MTATDPLIIEMQAIVRLASQPWEPGDNVRVAIGRAARSLGIGYRRARSFWYGEPVAVRAYEADQMRAAERAFLIKRYRVLEREMTMIEARLDRLRPGSVIDTSERSATEAGFIPVIDARSQRLAMKDVS